MTEMSTTIIVRRTGRRRNKNLSLHEAEFVQTQPCCSNLQTEALSKIEPVPIERIRYPMIYQKGETFIIGDTTMRRRRFLKNGRTKLDDINDDRYNSPTTSAISGRFSHFRLSLTAVVALFIAAIVQPCDGIRELRCGPFDIRNNPKGWRNFWSHAGDPNMVNDYYNQSTITNQINCTIIEGSFSMSFIRSKSQNPDIDDPDRYHDKDFPIFPYLREITGSILVFETEGLTNLGYIFPNLSVIGGQSLIQHYSLIVYRNPHLTDIGLEKLSVIRNGGVRIVDNPRLCYATSVDWKRLITSEVNDVYVDDAAESSIVQTGKLCQRGPCEDDPDASKCRYMETGRDRVQSCWTTKVCQKVCPYDRVDGNRIGPGCDPNGNRCHEECVGGCDKPGDASACNACKNMHYKGKCLAKCPPTHFVLMDRRCVSETECLALNPKISNVSVPIKATNGLCSHRCPHGYEVDPQNPKKCKKCDGECQIVCPIKHVIDTYAKALALKRCNIIEGDLKIEMGAKQDTGIANKLKEVFSSIHTITGYLQILRSNSLLSLEMFKNLRVIEGKTLFNDYALSIVENANLKKLFENNDKLEIKRGGVQFHNNRMLCFKHIRQMMTSAGKLKEMKEEDQSSTSNGDKAICEDSKLEARVSTVDSDSITIRWEAFNTSDIDFRKFLGYEIFFKEVDFININMSIDEDRSACVDSWNSVFFQYEDPDKEKEAKSLEVTLTREHRIRPHTIYAYYVATHMVHHQGAKNGVSRIGFVTTKFAVPEPPTLRISNVETDSMLLSWEPPERPNGVITHYMIMWREIDVDIFTLGDKFCADENTRSVLPYLTTGGRDYEPIELTTTSTASPSLTSLLAGTEGTCSATPGCCECSAMEVKIPSNADAEFVTEATRFENILLDEIVLQKCDFAKDPVGCAMVRRPPEWENYGSDGEDDDDESPTQRIRRNTEGFEREKRRMYQTVHSIRSLGKDQYDQFTAYIQKSIRTRRSIQNAKEMSEMLEKQAKAKEDYAKKASIKSTKKPLIHIDKKRPKTTTISPINGSNENSTQLPVVQDNYEIVAQKKWIKNVTALESGNMFELKGLKHFTDYTVTIAACQNTSVADNYCSEPTKMAKRKRTKALTNIDRVNNETIRYQHLNSSSDVHVTWDTVNETNGGITGYMVRMIGVDDRTPMTRCVGAHRNFTSEKDGVKFNGLADGDYRIEIVAYSAFGGGKPSIRYSTLTVYTPGFWTLSRIAIAMLIVIILIFICFVIGYYYVQVHYGEKVKAYSDFMQSNPEYRESAAYIADEWELELDSVILHDEIGGGNFGKVYLGEAKDVASNYGLRFSTCAVKIGTADPSEAENTNYLSEAQAMKSFKTEFVVKLYGVISSVTPARVVMELMELGNLRDYLRSKRDDGEFNETDCEYFDVISKEQFHEWASQICDGMAYLESLKFCHRDLAARNVMVDQYEKVKIGDFGMARDLFYHDYYKPSGKRLMPVRWMSPESLKDGKFDSKSDVWSFGIVLYEMTTLGAQPYIGLSNDEVLNYIGVARKIIKKPECCSDYWYKVMAMCWRYHPRDRPTFLQLVHLLAPNASDFFHEKSFVLNDNQCALDDAEPLDIDEFEVLDGIIPIDGEERRHTDSIPMQEFKRGMQGFNSHSTISMDDASTRPLISEKPKRQRSLDDEYALMNASGGPSDTEIRNYAGEGDYVERDVQMDMPTRRNTGASNASFNPGMPYSLPPRGNSNERAGFGEGVRLNDVVSSSNVHEEGDYVEKDVSMDTRRSTGASTASYTGQTNWSGIRGQTFYANDRQQANEQQQKNEKFQKQQQQLQQLNGVGRGDRLTQLPGTAHLQNQPEDDYTEMEAKPAKKENGSSRNGNSVSTPAGAFSERERLLDEIDHPLS